jgi:methylation protein EvaC
MMNMSKCLICSTDLVPFMSFGKMPLANGFLKPEQFREEFFFELKVGFCPPCMMIQLMEKVNPGKLYHHNYAFFSSTSEHMAEHFKRFATSVMENYLKRSNPFVVEIGSNDGILLQHFSREGIRHLGVEPSANVAQAASQKGVQTICDFFNEDLAHKIVNRYGKADAILGANVIAHIPYPNSVAKGVQILLNPGGVFVFEAPYQSYMLERAYYDQIYDEHVFYFSVTSLSRLCERNGLELVDILSQDVHGGSMRYVIARRGEQVVSNRVYDYQTHEKDIGLHLTETYEQFRYRAERSREDLMTLLRDLKKRSKRVVGYGATAKSTTVINFCGISPDLIEFICDTTLFKQGKFSPGAHIPIRPHEAFRENYPDYAVLFSWNHAQEIIAKEQEFVRSGGRWILYIPQVQVVEDPVFLKSSVV